MDLQFAKQIAIGILVLLVTFFLLQFLLQKIGKNSNSILPVRFAKRIKIPLFLFLLATGVRLGLVSQYIPEHYFEYIKSISTVLYIISITWGLIVTIKIIKHRVIRHYDLSVSDNLQARKIYTQFNILERIVIFIIILFAIGVALMSFDSIRSVGVSMLTSAGVAGIIIGFSAQKALGTLLAGIQIAFTQPIRMDDVVIVEGEWGTIEEITLTYVVIKIWDKRRLVVPTTYFIEKPFQNWTRSSSDLLGTVYIYTDYQIQIEALRTELKNILDNTPLWDNNVQNIQVTNATKDAIEIRALMSARNSSDAWDLRVLVREKLLMFIQKHHTESIPHTRIYLDKPHGTTDRDE
ncbi:mechanosensitive ion channel family protein [Aquimarina intermedia]|uniref:Small-conductance mechanosensitive channel n=1 Tax=Aquimarina intermedia TaxID=350814 RepID=A0A5S5BXA8_9FLAO|nr:mechanosensitive ion channel domain-containing protein [Aquimarina intermedia]TYP71667.1 small-conductance mechanosensitive channel [Aquimarina intermedia]